MKTAVEEKEKTYAELKPIPLSPLGPNPLVSVFMPNYNYGAYIGAALESLLVQTYANWEAIVVDDGSTDDSRSIIEGYARRDARIKPFFQGNAGVAAALNHAWSAARGEIIAFLDSDDLWAPTKLEVIVAAFHNNPHAGLVGHKMELIDQAGKSLHKIVPDNMDEGWIAEAVLNSGGECGHPPAAGLSINASIATYIFPLPLSIKGCLDSYISRAAALLTPAITLHELLGSYRIHGHNMTAATKYTARAAERNASDYWCVFDELKNFVERLYGPLIAQRLQPEHSPTYQQYVLIRHLFSHIASVGSINTAVRNLPTRRRVAWRLLLALPLALGRAIYNHRNCVPRQLYGTLSSRPKRGLSSSRADNG